MAPSSVDPLVAARLSGVRRPEPQGRRGRSACPAATEAPCFQEALARHRAEADRSTESLGVSFSRHALMRMERRGIRLGAEAVERLERAVSQAEDKGSRESLILMDDLALIVNVRDRIVVTAVDAASQKEGVFTNIDTVVMTRARETACNARSRPALSEEA